MLSSSRFLALAAAALSFVAAQDTVSVDDRAAAWTYTGVVGRITDTNAAVQSGTYTQVNVGGTATVSFVGSGASVYFVTPANTKGEWKFFLDGNDVGGVDIVRAIPQIGYNERLFSHHGLAIANHTIKIVATSAAFAVDALVYNPGAPSPADPDD